MTTPFETELAQWKAEFDTPGLAVEMLTGGRHHRAHMGLLAAGGNAPVTPKARFGTVCLIKLLISIECLLMAEKDEISLDAHIADYLPELGEGPKAKGQILKIRHLLSHTGGFRSYTVARLLPKAHESWQNCVELLHETEQFFEPGTVFDDEHLGHIILGQMIERLKGKPFLDVIRKEVLAPLGIIPGNRTQDADHPEIYAHRHGWNREAQLWEPEPDSYVEPDPAFGAISYLSMTSADLLRLGQVLLADGAPSAAPGISAWVRDQLFSEVVRVPTTFSPARMNRWSLAGFGLGMALFQGGHRGAVTTGRGQSSGIIFDGARRSVVALATNAPNVPGREALLNMLFATFAGDTSITPAPQPLDIGLEEFLGPFTPRDVGGLYLGFRSEPVEVFAGPRSFSLRIDREDCYRFEATPENRLIMKARLPMPVGVFQDPATGKPGLMMGVNAFKKVA
jgi:CubicO group peptidase (beta-lactamase class C family)